MDRWLPACNAFMAAFLAAAVAAPLLDLSGVYWLYSFVCHQDPEHSWFLLGRQMAFCQRDTAIYGSMLAAGLWYARHRDPRAGLPLWAYVLLCLPIALDGGTATLGVRESTPLLRTLTGLLFGGATVYFVYPLLDRSVPTASPLRAA